MEHDITKPCPYCGQMWSVETETERPEMLCRCPGAMTEQAREDNTEKMMQSLEVLFGEQCHEREPAFSPVEEEIYALLAEIVCKVGHEEIGAVSFSLRDGTSGKISAKGIERKRNITRKLG